MKIPLFDIDGTIFKDQDATHIQAYNYAFKNVYGIEAFYSEAPGQGRTDKQVILEVLILHGLNREKIEKKLEEAESVMTEYFLKNCKKGDLTVLPGVKNLLFALKKVGVKLGVLTGNVEEIAWKKLEFAGIKDFFDFGAFGGVTDKRVELVGIAKERADKKFNTDFPVSNFVIVGDTPKDIACAKQAGISVIAVSSGSYSFEDLEKYSPDLLVHSLTEQDKIMDFLTK